MKRKLFALVTALALAVLFLLPSCGSAKNTKSDIASVGIHDIIGGIFEATYPAADCPGIQTTVVFNDDKTISKSEFYLERSKTAELSNGTWEVMADGLIKVQIATQNPEFYAIIDKDSIRFLGMDTTQTQTELSDYYILKRK